MKTYKSKNSTPKMLRTYQLITLIAVALTLCACGKFSLYNPERGDQVAAVGDATLYEGDMKHLFNSVMTPEDSLTQRNLFIDQWVREQVKLQNAEKALSQFEDKIEDMVKEYRASLLKYQFDENFVATNLDTTVTQAQIKEFYNQNGENFRLAGPLVKARIARLPAGLRQSEKLQKMFRNTDSKQQNEDFVNICNKNNYRYNDLSESWHEFNQVLSLIPFSNTNFDEFLKTKNYYEVEDDQFKYMMVIVDKIQTGGKSPLEREQENIKRLLLHNRRGTLLKTLDDSLFNQAAKEGILEIKNRELTNAQKTTTSDTIK